MTTPAEAVRQLAAHLGPVRSEIERLHLHGPLRALPLDALARLDELQTAAEDLQQCLSEHMGVDPLSLRQRRERLELEQRQARERAALDEA